MKTTVLFGAGASREFYKPDLTADSLTAAVTDVGRWTRVLQHHAQLRSGGNSIEPSKVLSVLHEIQVLLPNAIFEDVVFLIDRISAFEHDGTPTSPGRFLLHDLLRLYKAEQRSRHSICIWFDVPFLARQLLAETLLTHERAPDYDIRCRQQGGFLAHLMHRGPLNITSLNYDESLFHSVAHLNIETGFHYERFDVQPYLSAHHTIAYPHGHVRFVPTNEGILLAHDGHAADERRWEGLKPGGNVQTSMWNRNPVDKTFDTFLVTGRLKDFALNENPYAAYYQRFANDLSATDLLIIVGYSFGDEHFNRFIINYADQDPDHRQVLIIEYDPDPLDMKAAWHPGHKLFHILRRTKAGKKQSLPFTLPPGTVDFEHASYTYAREVDKINARGYGTLYPGITYDKRGYRRFLEDYVAVLAAVPGTS